MGGPHGGNSAGPYCRSLLEAAMGGAYGGPSERALRRATYGRVLWEGTLEGPLWEGPTEGPIEDAMEDPI